ncbi:MAG: carboxypeptidase regulatory-like domain-containing protein [Armatimonadetes bacterium]|nr:carboxypeptidase regulatory-like domain-containing protein [Armatimonadota bacterium]
MSHARTLFLLLLLIGPAALLAGCGGGGGGSNNPGGGGGGGGGSQTGSVVGKVVDLTGAPVPSGVILVDAANQSPPPCVTNGPTPCLVGGASFGQGGYQLEGVPAGSDNGFHIITAQAANGNTGSTQVFIFSNGYSAANANIAVSPPGQQATVSGTVVNSSGQPLPGAEVFLRFPVAASQNNPTGYASLVAYTRTNGTYDIDNVPTQNADGSPRTYTATAAYQIPSPQPSDPVFDNAAQTNLTFTAGQTATLPTFTVPVHSGAYSALTPTLNLVQAFTQPNVPADLSAHALPAAAAASTATTSSTAAAIYEGIRRHLSPAYAGLRAAGHAAAQVRLLAARPHASATDYLVEMDLFFSLPGDTATQPSPQRSQVYGFEIYNNALQGILAPYAFLQDPLANFYDDPALGNSQVYAADTAYQFQVASEAATNANGGGLQTLGQPSNTVQAAPLSFVNLLHPLDPVDNNDVADRLSNPPTLQWSTVKPNTSTPDTRVASYSVFLYSAFPGVNTGATESLSGVNPNYIATYTVAASQSSPQTFTLPAGVVQSGHEYWVVVAATATDNTAQSQAISVSQITPFFVQ